MYNYPHTSIFRNLKIEITRSLHIIINNWSNTKMDLEKHYGSRWRYLWFEFMKNKFDDVSWYNLSMNKNVTMDFINQNPSYPWKWSAISYNPNLTLDFILKNIEKPWNWNAISCYANIPVGIMVDTPDYPHQHGHNYSSWCWEAIQCFHPITMELIQKYPKREWDWAYLCKNPHITVEMILDNVDDKDWLAWQYASRNPNLTEEFLEKYPDRPWNYIAISESAKITVEYVNKTLRKKTWELNMLSRNPNITMEMINSQPTWDWNYSYISRNPNLTMKMIKDHPNESWSWVDINHNPNIMLKDVLDNPNYPWNWASLSRNEFAQDKQCYVTQQVKNTLLLHLHIYYQMNTRDVTKLVEYVLFEMYLLMHVIKY